MDDDIDIEEHDVLDNPRIKSMFPDLSRVKLEIPDEEDIDEAQYGTLEPTEEPQHLLYQYEYSFETATDDLQEENHLHEEESEESHDYQEQIAARDSRNTCRIILGTKPDREVLYEEALNSHPVVYLENWKTRLKSSPCFCNTCEILFPTVNALDAHKMISHSYLVALEAPQKNTARKSTVTSKYCNHCSKTFPDDTSLIKHLYELLPLNNFSNVKDEKEPEKEKGKKLATPVPWPKKIKSPSHVTSKIHPTKKIKIEPQKVKIEPSSDTKPKLKRNILPRDGKFFAASSLVPKSTLFQCNNCQIGFLSCFSASQHSKSCKKVLTFDKCGICKRKIRTKDVKTHELQHSYNDKLKIYTMNKSIYERVLCKCPKCLCCFDELAFWAHYQKCKKSDKKSSYYCTDCDVNISSLRYKRHQLKHSTKKLTRKDFIIIEFYDQKIHSQKNQRVSTENKVEFTKINSKERQKLYSQKYRGKMSLKDTNKKDGGITLYYCEFCGCCQCILNYKGHTDGTCKEITSKKYCEKCGLCFTAKSIESHLILHEKKSFSLKNINIINLTTGKYIEPPMSEFYECKSCSKQFIYRRALNIHDCKTEKYITCKVCTKKFTIQAYKIHKLFHSVDKLMPELMKKYNSINSMWNVMYMCISCELITMTYDSAVTHSQGHLNYIISDLHKQCVVCDLKIAEKEFGLHEKLHSNNLCIERESFKILKYNHEDLFKKEWLKLFEDLPKEHRQKILSKSIYRFTRSVKMQIEISAGTEDEMKYFCMNCNSFVDGTNIKLHIRSKCTRRNKLTCEICHVLFTSLKHYLPHLGSHKSNPKRQTIVTFNNECDQEFNNHLSLIESQSRKSIKDVPLSQLRDLLLSDSAKTTYKLYKCVKCKVCVTLKSSIKRHRCVLGNKKRFCGICDQYFCAKKRSVHLEAHKKKPYINKDSFYVVYFSNDGNFVKFLSKKDVTAKVSPKKDTVVKMSSKKEVTAKFSPKKEVTPKMLPKKLVIAKIYRCQCGLHFTSLKTVEKHLDACSPNLDVSKETCSKCKLVFPTEVLVTHLINHHHKETRIVIEKVARADLYKCPNCAIHFTDMYNFNLHIENCFMKNGTQCKICRLSFGMKCFAQHLCSTAEVTYINKITLVRKNVVKQETVYRCTPCDVTYLQRNSFRYHCYEVDHLLKKPPTICDVCGLKFTNCSFIKHTIIHSVANEDYKIKVLDPITGNFVFVTGNNPVNGSKRSPRKRRGELLEPTDDVTVKKGKISEIDQPLSERRMSRKAIDRPSTSRDSRIDFNETPTEMIIPDEISNHIIENISYVSNTDSLDITSPEKINETLDKSGISNKLKSRILVKGYSKELFKCVHCNQHYMKESSFDYHVKTYNHNLKPENYECDICGLDFSRYTLPRHKYVHHDRMRLKKEDLIIREGGAYSKEDLKAQNDSKILGISSEIRDDTKVSENDTEQLNNVNVSDTCDTKKLSDVNVSDTCDTKKLSDVNVSDNCDTEQPNDVNVNDISDNNIELTENISAIDKICYYKCSDCNVCFVDHENCYKHTLNHKTLDPLTYIQCKICDFQFLIDSLKEHMVLHHNSDFRIESLTVREYKASGTGEEPKVDIYLAVDKVQSRLVSTTTDMGVV